MDKSASWDSGKELAALRQQLRGGRKVARSATTHSFNRPGENHLEGPLVVVTPPPSSPCSPRHSDLPLGDVETPWVGDQEVEEPLFDLLRSNKLAVPSLKGVTRSVRMSLQRLLNQAVVSRINLATVSLFV